MQYTSNYNLMLPEGTDTVNLLTQMNPNTSDIDAALYANKQMCVGRATESTSGTVHAITRANADSPIFSFTATSDWTHNDTMSVDGVACSVYLTDGTLPGTGCYVINSEVLAIVQGSRVTLFCPKIGAAKTILSPVMNTAYFTPVRMSAVQAGDVVSINTFFQCTTKPVIAADIITSIPSPEVTDIPMYEVDGYGVPQKTLMAYGGTNSIGVNAGMVNELTQGAYYIISETFIV